MKFLVDSLTKVSLDGRQLGTVVDAFNSINKDDRGILLDALLDREKEQNDKNAKALTLLQEARDADQSRAEKTTQTLQVEVKDLSARVESIGNALDEAQALNATVAARIGQMVEDGVIDITELAELQAFATAPAKQRLANAKRAEAARLLAQADALK